MSRHHARKAKSRQWWQKHQRDPFVKQAKKDGYRSRASYKLLDIQQKFQIINKNDVVVDLGCAPGGWAEVAREWTGENGLIIGVDKTPVKPLQGITTLVADISDPLFIEKISNLLQGQTVNCVISDIAPDTIGHAKVDRIRMANAIEDVWNAIQLLLGDNGNFTLKIRDGAVEDPIRLAMKSQTQSLKPFKPKASQSSSSELYLVGLGFQKPSP